MPWRLCWPATRRRTRELKRRLSLRLQRRSARSPAAVFPAWSTNFTIMNSPCRVDLRWLCRMAMPRPASNCLEAAAAGHPAQFSWEQTDYTLGSAPVGDAGLILVAIPLPPQFSQTVHQVEASQQRYVQLAHERRLVRRTYMGLLLLLTMMVLFVTTWLALFLSKLVTRPLAALAEATQEISRGRLDYRIDVSAADEIGDLVRSFNRMAEELEVSRRQIEASSRDASAASAELDQRRRQMETILESIPTGVLSLDAGRTVTHANQALQRMFHPDGGHDGARQVLRQ